MYSLTFRVHVMLP